MTSRHTVGLDLEADRLQISARPRQPAREQMLCLCYYQVCPMAGLLLLSPLQDGKLAILPEMVVKRDPFLEV